MFLVIGSFLAGMLTVLAPCVLPLLPVIIGGSISGNTRDKKRPVIIVVSLALSLFVFTLLLKASSLLFNAPPELFTYVSGSIIILLGILTLFPGVYAQVLLKLGIEQRAQQTLNKGYQNKNQYIGPIIIGVALGPVFSSCSPVYAYILATVLPVNFNQAIIYIISYILGLTVVLLLIGYFGQKFVSKIKFASDPRGLFQRFIAVLFIIVGLLIITGYDKKFQTWVSTHTPFNIDSISQQFLPEGRKTDNSELFNVQPYPAKEFTTTDQWINSKPLTMEELKGKVVLVDFWTYSCINCIRNNPYLAEWYQKYKDQGLVIVGVHAPEFSFEKNINNVKKAVKEQNIPYPVMLDNDFATWNAYENRSWPTSYLIDASGQVRRVHEGEGEYDKEEKAIRQLLEENGKKVSSIASGSDRKVPVTNGQTPETYLGSTRASNFENDQPLAASPITTFTEKQTLDKNDWTLGGTWEVQSQKIIARGNSTLKFHIAAKEAYLVMGSSSPQPVGIKLNDTSISKQGVAGSDVKNDTIHVQEYRLYRLVKYKEFRDDGTITLSVPDGVELNAFTFGS